MNTDTIMELLNVETVAAVRDWDNEQWGAASDALALVAKSLRGSGYPGEANTLEAIESALFRVWWER